MDEWAVIAFAVLGLSSFISAIKFGRWMLDADPKLLAHAGQWSLLLLTFVALGILAWLEVNGRWTHAMMLAAFVLPIVVEAAPRWRGSLRPFVVRCAAAAEPRSRERSHSTSVRLIDPELAEHCAAVPKAYLEQIRREVSRLPSESLFLNGPMDTSTQGPTRMSAKEALEVLGLDPGPSVDEINAAHRRLGEKLGSDSGGTRYLASKINEARQILLEG